jgi:hypothetical protein
MPMASILIERAMCKPHVATHSVSQEVRNSRGLQFWIGTRSTWSTTSREIVAFSFSNLNPSSSAVEFSDMPHSGAVAEPGILAVSPESGRSNVT